MHNKKHTPKQVYFLEPLLVNSNKRKHLSYEYITKYLKSFFHVSEQNILITEHKNGKPHSPQLHLAYNASHSGNLISVAFSSPFVSAAQIKAEYIVADMQFVLYDEKAVGQLIQDSGLVFSCENTDGMQSRVIYQGSEPVWSMEKTETHISVKNYLRNYSYDIEILMSSEIPTTE